MRNNLKILLLQIRDDEATTQEEIDEFVRFSKLDASQIHTINSYDNHNINPKVIHDYDGVMVGGSSDASVLDPVNFIFINNLKDVLQYCYKIDKPVLASCFGFQLAVEALHGKVIKDLENMEMGIYNITFNENSKKDPLLYDYPSEIWAVSGHKERALKLPKDAILLASSELCPYQVFKIKDKPFYAFQFHPEVDREDLILRITRYKERYLDNDEHLKEIISHMQHDTTFANKLIEDFVDRIVLKP